MPIGPSTAVDPARRVRFAGWSLVTLAGVLVIGFPLFDLGRELVAAGGHVVVDVVGSGRAWGPIAATLWTSAAATILTLAGATAAALAIRGVSGRRRALVIGGMVLPLLIPAFVTALSWLSAFGPGGLVDDLTGVALPGLIGPLGVVLVLVVSAMPIAFLIVNAALDTRREQDLVRAARVAGASPRQAFRTVTLPLLRPALVGAGAVTFIMSANAFGVPAVLGSPAGFGTATTRLYRDLVFSADAAAFDRVLVLAAFLAAITFAVVMTADRSGSARLRMTVEASGPREQSRPLSRRATAGFGAWIGLTTVVPLLALVLTALTRSVGLAPVPANLTLRHFSEALESGAAAAFGRSLTLGLLAASIVVVLGSVLVALERRRRRGAGTLIALAFAVPGSVIAVAVLLAWGPWLRDTILLILIAYVAKFWALGHRPIEGSAGAVSPELFAVARLSGASPSVAVKTITLPLLAPAIVAAWLVVFLFSLHELTMSSLLYGPGSETLAVAVLDLQQLGDPTVTAALAVLLTMAVALASVPLVWLTRSRRLRAS